MQGVKIQKNSDNTNFYRSNGVTVKNLLSIINSEEFNIEQPLNYKSLNTVELPILSNFNDVSYYFYTLPRDTIILCYLVNEKGQCVNKKGIPEKVITLAKINDNLLTNQKNIAYSVEVLEGEFNKNFKFYTSANRIKYPKMFREYIQ